MITHLRLVNFRKYTDQEFTFAPRTIIVGPNGQGKTNIIESLFFLSTGRSFRTNLDREVIRFGQPFARIISDPLDLTIVAGERTKKNLRIHGKPMRLLNILGVLPSVLFTPTSLALVDGGPSLRRQFMDILLSQTDTRYARELLEYQRILKQRNELLHQISLEQAPRDTLSLWDDLLVQAGSPVIFTRKKMAESIQQEIDGWYQALGPRREEKLEAIYISSVEKRGVVSNARVESLFIERLRERRLPELAAGRTLVGPHRDDLMLTLNKRPIADYGSRGQMRSAVIALKLFEYSYMKEQSGKEPTLLFDDVFSEFDHERRRTILKIIPDAQLIVTATDSKAVGRLPSRATVINLTDP